MKNTIIASIVAILCTIAICVTVGVVFTEKKSCEEDKTYGEYLTEEEAAEYLGLSEDVVKMMREKLGKFKGACVEYTYLDEKGETVTAIIYNKTQLDEQFRNMMKESPNLNFKTLQEIYNKAEKETTSAATK